MGTGGGEYEGDGVSLDYENVQVSKRLNKLSTPYFYQMGVLPPPPEKLLPQPILIYKFNSFIDMFISFHVLSSSYNFGHDGLS